MSSHYPSRCPADGIERNTLRHWTLSDSFGIIRFTAEERSTSADTSTQKMTMANRLAHFTTNLGDFQVELFEGRAPATTKNF